MSVASKNPFELLAKDDDAEFQGPVKTVDKTSTRTTKRNADVEPVHGSAAPPGGGRRGALSSYSGNEAAFRDRNAGSDRNRGKYTEEGSRGGSRGGYGARVRGGRGSRHPRDRDDRHNKGLPGGASDKQAAQGWGATEGEAELKDEQAGEEIAQTEQKQADGDAAEGEKEEPAEPEEKQVSFADYLAQQAEKKLALESDINIRKPNEGTKMNKKWANAKPLSKDEDEDYVAGTGGKVKRERERKTKQLVEIDNRYVEPERLRGGRGGRGGGGGGGRGSTRGDARGGSRGDSRGGGRGGVIGGRGGGGGRGRGDGPINPNDQSAFPTLGS